MGPIINNGGNGCQYLHRILVLDLPSLSSPMPHSARRSGDERESKAQ